MKNNNIFSRQPFEKPNSYKFIKASKDGESRVVKRLLETNKYLIYDYDHVSASRQIKLAYH